MGKLKRRIRPNDITINIGKDAPIPECPIPGERLRDRENIHFLEYIKGLEVIFNWIILTLIFLFDWQMERYKT